MFLNRIYEFFFRVLQAKHSAALIVFIMLFCRLAAAPVTVVSPHYVPAREDSTVIKKEKGVAVFLAVTVGVLGVHRWYLGTSTATLVAYALTFGGFGIVTVIDIVQLIRIKDISRYSDNPDFFMWRKDAVTTPGN